MNAENCGLFPDILDNLDDLTVVDRFCVSVYIYIQGQRIVVEKVRNVFVMGEAFSI